MRHAALCLLLWLATAPRVSADVEGDLGLNPRAAALGGAVSATGGDFTASAYSPAALIVPGDEDGFGELSVGYTGGAPAVWARSVETDRELELRAPLNPNALSLGGRFDIGNGIGVPALDQDADGQPGVTIEADTVLCRAPGELYLALRATVEMSATIDDLDRIEGAVTPTLDQSVLGVSDRCLNAAASLDVELLEGSTFTALRVGSIEDYDGNGNVSCPEIALHAEALFGDFWAE